MLLRLDKMPLPTSYGASSGKGGSNNDKFGSGGQRNMGNVSQDKDIMEVQLVVHENPDLLKAAVFIAALFLGMFALAGLFFVVVVHWYGEGGNRLLRLFDTRVERGGFRWRQFFLNLYNLGLAVVLAIPEIKPQWAEKSQSRLYRQVSLLSFLKSEVERCRFVTFVHAYHLSSIVKIVITVLYLYK